MIEKQLSPDSYQRQAIDIDKNAVVSAGAGSGKTTVLANRYLRLVMEGKAGVENILTLTFTRKAAREMRSRIYALLLKNSRLPRVREQLRLFERSQISTLDSFCSQISRNWTQRFGVSPDFKVDEDAAVKEAVTIALELMLERSEDAALSELIYVNGFEPVLHDFFVAFARSRLTVAKEFDFDEMWRNQKQLLDIELHRQIGELEEIVAQMLVIDPGELKSVKKAAETAAGLKNVRSLALDGRYEELGEILAGMRIRTPPAAHNPAAGQMRALVDPLKTVVGSLADLIATFKSEELIKGMLDVSDEFQRRIISSRRSSGILLYHDVVEMAKICLLENIELRRYYKRRFTHIMIDEFQDNNRIQKEILYLLAERAGVELPRVPDAGELDTAKLFFVGDEKQSIYMFRGADVTVFKELSGEMKKNGGKALSLPKNYRTEPGLIDFFNTVFSTLMRDADHNFDARYEALQRREALLPTAPCIQILYKPHREATEEKLAHGDDAEAMAVARFIKDSVELKKLEVVEDDIVRPAEYGDFALLMRSTSNQNRYERALRITGIPHSVDSTRSLFLESPVNDIYNLLQLAVYPEDRAAYAALLRSPFVNVSDDGFIVLLLSDDHPFAEAAINDSVIEAPDREKLRRAAFLYQNVRAAADKISLTELVSEIWYRYGYRYMLLRDPALHRYLEYYDYVRELARTADAASMSLVGFLDILRPHLGKYERLEDLDVLKDEETTPNGVRLLTVHRAKGLEFPVVILANTGNRGNDPDSGAPFYYTDEIGVTFNIARELGEKGRKVNYFYRRGRDEQLLKETAETKRVLYVALTRAKHHLVISGRHGLRNQRDTGVPLNMILTSFGWEPGTEVAACEALKPYLREIPEISTDVFGYPGKGEAAEAGRRVEEALQDYRNAAVPETPPSPPEWTATGLERLVSHPNAPCEELPSLECDSVLSDLDLDAAFGTLCHSVIEAGFVDGDTAVRVPAILRERLDEDSLALVMREAKRLAAEFLISPAGSLLDGARRIDTEVPFLLRYERRGAEAFIHGVIDLVVERVEENIIVDFKTDRFLHDGEYFLQASIYREAVMEWTGRTARCYLLYLRNNALIEVPERPLPDLFALAETINKQGETV